MAKRARLNHCLGVARKFAKDKLTPEQLESFEEMLKSIDGKLLREVPDHVLRAQALHAMNDKRQKTAAQVLVKHLKTLKDRILDAEVEARDTGTLDSAIELIDAETDMLETRTYWGRLFGESTGPSPLVPALMPRLRETNVAVFSGLERQMTAANISPRLMQSDVFADAVGKSMLNIDSTHNMPKDVAEKVLQAKNIWRAEQRKWRDLGAPAGILLDDIEHHFTQSWSSFRIFNNKDRFIELLSGPGGLDSRWHPHTAATIDHFLSTVGEMGASVSPDRTLDLRRKIHISDPNVAWKLHKEFGDGSTYEVMVSSLQSLVDAVVMAQDFGPEPAALMRERLKRAGDKASRRIQESDNSAEATKARALINKRVSDGNKNIDFFAERFRPPEDPGIAAGFNLMRSFVGLTAYVNVAYTSLLQDPMLAGISNMSLAGRRGPLGYMGSLWRTLRPGIDGLSKEEAGLLLEHANIGFTHYAASVVNGVAPLEVVFSSPHAPRTKLESAAKLTGGGVNTMMQWTGANAVLNGLRHNTAIIALHEFGKVAGKSLTDIDELNPALSKRIREAGFNEARWKSISKPAYLTYGLIDGRKIDDFKARQYLTALTSRQINSAVIQPNLITQRYLSGVKGTWSGEAKRSYFGLWSFAVQFGRTAIAQTTREYGWGRGMAWLAAVLLPGAFILTQLREKFRGRPYYRYDDPEFLLRVLGTSGLTFVGAAVAADAVRSQQTGDQFSVWDSFGDQAGPLFELMSKDIPSITAGVAGDIAEEGELSGHTKALMVRTLASKTPLTNWLPLQAGMSMVYDKTWSTMLEDSVSPEAEQRRRLRWIRQGRHEDLNILGMESD